MSKVEVYAVHFPTSLRAVKMAGSRRPLNPPAVGVSITTSGSGWDSQSYDMAAPLNLLRIDTRQANVRQALAELRERLSPRGNIVSEAGRRRTIEVFGEALSPQQVVERICQDVRTKGLSAVLDYSARIDRANLTADTIRVSAAELVAAHSAASPEFLAAIRRIRENILRFQSAILQRDVRVALPAGGYLRQRYLPLARVGICVPGGAAAYPSTVLMTAVPAQAAGVKQLAIVAPPTNFGANNPDVLATCHELGISEVYRLGGAQAVAALAYGVEGVPKVDKIVGPGNLFVALAKRYRVWRSRYRFDRRPERSGRRCRRNRTARFHCGRFDRPGRACAGLGNSDHLARAADRRGGRRTATADRTSFARRFGPPKLGTVRGIDFGPRRRRGLRLADEIAAGALAHRGDKMPNRCWRKFRTPGRRF